MSDNTPITLTHAQIENSMPHVIHSYRWERDGTTTTLNVRVDTIEDGGSQRGSFHDLGAKVLNLRRGFNPDEVREQLDLLHARSQEYEEPPEAINHYKREAEREREKNRREIEQMRRDMDKGQSLIERAKERLQG